MSYLDQTQDPRRRATALATTAAVHAALAVAVVTGLSVAGYAPLKTYDPIIEFPVEPEPPEPAPPPPQPNDPVVTLPRAPEPPLELQPVPDPMIEPLETAEVAVITRLPDPVATATPRPQPSFVPKRATPSNGPASWISNADYPRRALVDEAEGSVGYRLVIGTGGRVSSCELTRPSGHRALDDATCRLITGRARFEPATDETGAKVLGTYTGSVRWEIPD